MAREQAICVKQKSLANNISMKAFAKEGGLLAFSQMSNNVKDLVQEDINHNDHKVAIATTIMLSQGFVEAWQQV